VELSKEWKEDGLVELGNSKQACGLGFRELEIFNLALLAKQGWRILQNPESLVARIFKEKYFPKDSFLEAQVGRRPSYAWRSITQAWSILEAGLLWRVGDGNQISIWKDKWLPNLSISRIQSPVSILPSNARVSSLIDHSNRGWNVSLINLVFSQQETDSICSIPLSPFSPPDRMI